MQSANEVLKAAQEIAPEVAWQLANASEKGGTLRDGNTRAIGFDLPITREWLAWRLGKGPNPGQDGKRP